MTASTILYVPWSPEVVEMLKRRQADAETHPYSCMACEADLLPTELGWVCPQCSLVQNWCLVKDANGEF
jgi:hypothetical protein